MCPAQSSVTWSAVTVKHVPLEETSAVRRYVVPAVLRLPQELMSNAEADAASKKTIIREILYPLHEQSRQDVECMWVLWSYYLCAVEVFVYFFRQVCCG
jgi:hypothetical protein